jgi:diguanylate cyclase (GGDEF)-like protein
MNDAHTDQTDISYEVQRQFLRRTPVKLKQFARLLNDMLEQEVDDLRVKALSSQVIKTREACLAQQFDSTARLLNQLQKQLAMNKESLKSQKPLLKRLSKRLLEHAQQLELGVKPQKLTTAEKVSDKNSAQLTQDIEASAITADEDDITGESQGLANLLNEVDAPVSFDSYIEKGKLIFVVDSDAAVDSSSAKTDYSELHQQFTSMGVESCTAESLEQAKSIALEQFGSIIISNLDQVTEQDVRADEEIEKDHVPIIFIADEDSQTHRAKSIRNGGTGFVVDPVSLSTLCNQIEQLYDLEADSARRILVMEDSKAQARYYEKVLSKGHFETRVVNDPAILLENLREFEPECVLMDMQMPDSSGIELTQMIRQMPKYTHLPIIFLSAEENLRKQNQALKSGGTAFIVKPVQKDQLMFMADLYTDRFRALSPQIEINPDTELSYFAHFKQTIALEAARMSRSQTSIALAAIEIDPIEFSSTENESLEANYSFTSNVLVRLSHLLKKRLRKTDLVGHLNGNTLGIVLTSGRAKDWSEAILKIQEEFVTYSFQQDNLSKKLSISVGISSLGSNYDPHQWLEESYSALKEAQLKGPNSFVFEKSS